MIDIFILYIESALLLCRISNDQFPFHCLSTGDCIRKNWRCRLVVHQFFHILIRHDKYLDVSFHPSLPLSNLINLKIQKTRLTLSAISETTVYWISTQSKCQKHHHVDYQFLRMSYKRLQVIVVVYFTTCLILFTKRECAALKPSFGDRTERSMVELWPCSGCLIL